MDNATLQIADNVVVSLAYTLIVEGGAADSEQPTQHKKKQASKRFVQGRHQVVRGLEKELYGMTVGDEKEIVVQSPKEYGEVDPAAIKTLPRQSVPSFSQATPGQKLRLLHKSSGKVQRATVVDVQPETIVLDFNHPLAGKTLHYHVRVDELRPATPAEIESGKVQESVSEQPASQDSTPA